MKSYTTIALLLISISVFAQDYKGIWSGYMRAEAFNVSVLNVQYILHVKEQNQNIVNGKAYIFRNSPLHAEGILDFIGIVNKNKLKIVELKILYSKIPNDTISFICIKNLDLELTHHNGLDDLRGIFTGAGEYQQPCYPGKVYLQRFNKNNQETIPAAMLTTILLDDTDPNVFLKTKLARPIVIDVVDNVIELEINDYLKQDNDIISVYHNRRLIIKNLTILNKPYKQTLRFNRNSELQEIIIYAENLGQIPPNTSNLKVFDGVKIHQVLIQSSKEVSAVVYLRYLPPQKSPQK